MLLARTVPAAPTASLRRQRGVTLVEILVTVVIISVGLLGVAGLHLTSLRSGQGAHVRSQATALTADILDRMRANPEAARNHEYAITMSAAAPITPVGLVAMDKKQWLDALAAALPGGDGSVETAGVTLAGQPAVRVTIQWAERLEANGTTTPTAPPNTFVTVARL